MNQLSESISERTCARIQNHGEGVGVPSPEAVERRAKELAKINGRTPDSVTDDDRIHASRELHDETLVLSSQESRSDLVASRNPADIAVEMGHRVTNMQPSDEQQIEELEVEEGVREAEHERMLLGHQQKN